MWYTRRRHLFLLVCFKENRKMIRLFQKINLLCLVILLLLSMTSCDQILKTLSSFEPEKTSKEPNLSLPQEEPTTAESTPAVEPEQPSIGELAYELNADSETCTVVGIGTVKGNDITIPAYIDGHRVTAIGQGAFANCSHLENVVIDEGIMSIEEEAFEGCRSLLGVTIPNSIISVGRFAFADCDQFLQIENGISYAGRWAVDCDETVTSANLRQETVGIADNTFFNHDNLVNVKMPDTLLVIGNSAFFDCYSLSSVLIPPNTRIIGDSAFNCCVEIRSIHIPQSVVYVGGAAFAKCHGLTDVFIPGNIKVISNLMFYDCPNLVNVTIAQGITQIGSYAFEYCSALTDVTIPNSVTLIGDNAFEYCHDLSSIYFKGTKAEWASILKEDDWIDGNVFYTVHCSDGDVTKQ